MKNCSYLKLPINDQVKTDTDEVKADTFAKTEQEKVLKTDVSNFEWQENVT